MSLNYWYDMNATVMMRSSRSKLEYRKSQSGAAMQVCYRLEYKILTSMSLTQLMFISEAWSHICHLNNH